MDISRQQSTALWNIVIIVCSPLLGMIGNELVVCYIVTDMLLRNSRNVHSCYTCADDANVNTIS